MIVKLLTEHHLEFLSLSGGCRGSFESTLVKLLEISCRSSMLIINTSFEINAMEHMLKRLFSNIEIKHDFLWVNVCWTPRVVFNSSLKGEGF